MPYIIESCGTKMSQNKGPWESKPPGKQRPQEIKSQQKRSRLFPEKKDQSNTLWKYEVDTMYYLKNIACSI